MEHLMLKKHIGGFMIPEHYRLRIYSDSYNMIQLKDKLEIWIEALIKRCVVPSYYLTLDTQIDSMDMDLIQIQVHEEDLLDYLNHVFEKHSMDDLHIELKSMGYHQVLEDIAHWQGRSLLVDVHAKYKALK